MASILLLHFLAVFCGTFLDTLIGDPEGLPHPVQAIGLIISAFERLVLGKKQGHYAKGVVSSEKQTSDTKQTDEAAAKPGRQKTTNVSAVKSSSRKAFEFVAGILLAVLLLLLSIIVPFAILYALYKLNIFLCFVLYVFMTWQIMAAGSMAKEARGVDERLAQDDLPGGRKAVARIVGRDTANLSKEEVIKAAVESVAESTSDGILNPLFYLIFFGPMGGFAYKSANTMDSMIGYHNSRYEYFGKAGARLDDIMGWIPARFGGLFMLLVGSAYKYQASSSQKTNAFSAWNYFRRLPSSPNAGQTEAAMALSLGIELGGPALYAGKLINRPRLGYPEREPETEDITRSVAIMYRTELVFFLFFTLLALELGAWIFLRPLVYTR